MADDPPAEPPPRERTSALDPILEKIDQLVAANLPCEDERMALNHLLHDADQAHAKLAKELMKMGEKHRKAVTEVGQWKERTNDSLRNDVKTLNKELDNARKEADAWKKRAGQLDRENRVFRRNQEPREFGKGAIIHRAVHKLIYR